jgi:hypothetical protein
MWPKHVQALAFRQRNRPTPPEELAAPGPYRLCRATASAHWVLALIAEPANTVSRTTIERRFRSSDAAPPRNRLRPASGRAISPAGPGATPSERGDHAGTAG